MPHFVLLLGPPASGKTTFIAENMAKFADYVYLDPDVIRKYGWTIQRAAAERDRMAKRLIDKAESNIIYPSTGGYSSWLKSLLTKAKSAGFNVTIILIKTDLQTALNRNAARKRHVPEDIIRKRFVTCYETFGRIAHLADRKQEVQS